MPTETEHTEHVYMHKSWQYTHDPAWTPSVINYLRTNIAEATAHLAEATPGSCAAFVRQARLDAYTDALRVLADADDAAYRWAGRMAEHVQ